MTETNKKFTTSKNKATDDFDFNKMTEEQKEIFVESIKLNNQHIKYPLNDKQAVLWKYKF